MLTLQNVSKTITNSKKESKELLENINLTIRPGEFVALSGSSNSGKSALAEIVAVRGIDYQGEYYIDGIELSKYSPKQLKEMVLSKFTYNEFLPNLNPRKTILVNFLTALSHIKVRNKWRRFRLKAKRFFNWLQQVFKFGEVFYCSSKSCCFR